jgi:hypothetical protein
MHDVGQNMLSVLLDRLDAKKTATRNVLPARAEGQNDPTVIELTTKDVTPDPVPVQTSPEKDELAEWVSDFCGASE